MSSPVCSASKRGAAICLQEDGKLHLRTPIHLGSMAVVHARCAVGRNCLISKKQSKFSYQFLYENEYDIFHTTSIRFILCYQCFILVLISYHTRSVFEATGHARNGHARRG